NKKYNLTEYSFHTFVKPIQKHFKDNIDSFTIQKIATRCFSAFQKLMLHKANRVYFKKYGEMNSVEGKSNGTGIRFKDNKLLWNGLEINTLVKKNDEYAQISLLNKVKFCRIVRKFVRKKYKYYIQLILEGVPPLKYNKETGEVRNIIGEGNVGIDIGTQTIGIASRHEVKLLELAPQINNIETIKRKLLRKLDRKQSHEKLANYILSLGNVIKVESMNYKGLQKRSKETTVSEKTGKFNKKKRFGRSLANKAPSMFLTILDNKLKWNNEMLYKINTYKVKASQYNHFDSECNQKELSERWNYFNVNNEIIKIQRDLYSSFLIMNVKDNLEEVDRELCFGTYDNFKHLHDKEINRLLSSNNKRISSMGI
ncbi:RNA-guided endonuclease TnpB family protein, partial [Clostridium sp.]|uniref:RNA-guided endonuclease TnpB family protein n=1 Tax=Clostridium sp. TaxID=1506 RepID=UPI003EE9D178